MFVSQHRDWSGNQSDTTAPGTDDPDEGTDLDGEWEPLPEANVPVNKPAPVPVTNAVKRREIPAKSIVGADVPAFEKAIDKELSSWSKH